MSYPSPTDGQSVAVAIGNVPKTLTLSKNGRSPLTTFYTLAPEVTDVDGTVQTGTPFTLSAVAGSSGSPGTAVYTGTITGGGSNAFAGQSFTIAGFVVNTGNNGVFECTASSATTLTLTNPFAVAESHAATATPDDANLPFEYISRSTGVVTVTAAGVIEAVAVGAAVVEVSYPFANNTLGTNPDGTYAQKVYAEVNVQVVI